MVSERMTFESDEVRGIANRLGGHRCAKNGIGFWHLPPWFCSHCGPGAEVQAGCPDPLSRHGAIEWPECFR